VEERMPELKGAVCVDQIYCDRKLSWVRLGGGMQRFATAPV